MRIGLYGLPSSGKTTLLNQVDFAPVLAGSPLLLQLDPSFHDRTEEEQESLRRQLAEGLRERDGFLMDGHYAFGETVVFTEEDGALYDAFLYLYVDPEVLRERMARSEKNRKYLAHDAARWQRMELEALRSYCHSRNKDFYVLDAPPGNVFDSLKEPIGFLRAILDGYSCVRFARACAERILSDSPSHTVILTDGDRTLTLEDSSAAAFQYKTHIFDGNFYTGYQSWRQGKDFRNVRIPSQAALPVRFSERILDRLDQRPYILTYGHPEVWKRLSERLGFPCLSGEQMSADAKFFITKFLREAGREVTAYGDSMNDYYMLRQADRGYLVSRPDGSLSRSLRGMDLGGIELV